MSMTYYAVTDDPNELAHFGIKGMKWGVRHDKPRHSGSRRRSAAYKRASGKLSKLMKSGIKKAEANWKTYNSPQAKEKRFMDKAMQKARNGTLKYGKLTDAQVRRVTERLALERNARQLGSTENPRFVRRLGTAVSEGIIRGVGLGTASYLDERFRGRGKVTAEIKGEERKAKYESSARGQQQAARKVHNDIAKEYYKTAYEEGDTPKYYSAERRAKYLADVKARNKKNEYAANVQKVYDEQAARSKAVSDSQRNDWRRNAMLADINSGNRRLGGTGFARLNADNNRHEAENARLERQLSAQERTNAINQRRASEASARARSDRAFNEALRNKQRQDMQREAARVKKEQERQERLAAENADRARMDYHNTSNKRKRKNGNRK